MGVRFPQGEAKPAYQPACPDGFFILVLQVPCTSSWSTPPRATCGSTCRPEGLLGWSTVTTPATTRRSSSPPRTWYPVPIRWPEAWSISPPRRCGTWQLPGGGGVGTSSSYSSSDFVTFAPWTYQSTGCRCCLRLSGNVQVTRASVDAWPEGNRLGWVQICARPFPA